MSGWGNFVWDNGYGDTAPWAEDTAVPYDGRPSLRSAPIAQNESSSLASGLFDNTAGTITWAWRVDSRLNYDKLLVHLDRESGERYLQGFEGISGNEGWAEYSISAGTLPPGQFRLVFSYTKEAADGVGSDAAWIAPISGFPVLPPAGSEVAVAVRAPLAVPGAYAQVWPWATMRATSPLSVPRAQAMTWIDARVSARSALGRPGGVAAQPAVADIAVPSPLGQPTLQVRRVRLAPVPAYAPAPGRLLADPLPLRKGSDLPHYRTNRELPWVYGRVWISPVPLDSAGLLWLVADHPVTAVERVTVAGVQIDGWQLVQQVDATGQAVALLRLTRPPADGGAIAVRVVGRRHPVTGQAIEHPADIVADLLRQCGWVVAADAFQGLREAYPALALGMVFGAPVPLRDAIGAVIEPIGAVWSAPRVDAWARRPRNPVATLDASAAERVSARAAAELASVARISYAYDWAAGAARETLTVEAPEAIERYGRMVVDIAMPAVRTARDALEIGSARLADMARPQWQIEISVAGADAPIDAGDTVFLAHPRIPGGSALITATARDRTRDMLDLTAWLPAGGAPRVVLAQRGLMVEADRAAPSAVVYRDGVATFTVTDDSGMPLAGAAVVLDGQAMRNTDRFGRVQFTTSRGAHTLSVYMDGYAPFQMDVTV